MPAFICTTCGTQYAETTDPPAGCAICQDERQYVKATGQQWTTLDKLRLTNRNSLKFQEPGLLGVGIDPPFAIGQRALFLRSPGGNLLWDCLSLLDQHVAYLVIGTHSREIEGRLFATLLGRCWRLEIERPAILALDGDGPSTTVDGVQGWRNLDLVPCRF